MNALRNNAFRLRVLANTIAPTPVPFSGKPVQVEPPGKALDEIAALLRELADEAEQREAVERALDAKVAR